MMKKRQIIFTCVGAAIEWYDFAIFIFLAPILSLVFFPAGNHFVGLIKIYGIYAVSFIFRPIGGILLASIGDRIGRKPTIILALSLMALSQIISACAPSYKNAGIFAVMIILFTRVLQGFSLGGQYNGILVMLAESAPANRRGMITACGTMFAGFGIVASALTLFMVSHLFHQFNMVSFGWRIPFVCGFLLSLLAIIMQFKINESLAYTEIKNKKALAKNPVRSALNKNFKHIAYVFCLAGYISINSYIVAGYLPGFLHTALHYSLSQTMLMVSISVLLYAVTAPFWGLCSDYIGRKRLLFMSILVFTIIILPCYMLIKANSPITATLIFCLLQLTIAAMTAPFVSYINELFPTKHRYSGVSTGYNLGNSLLGGTAPVLAAWLTLATGWHTASALYIFILSIIMLIILSLMPPNKTRAN